MGVSCPNISQLQKRSNKKREIFAFLKMKQKKVGCDEKKDTHWDVPLIVVIYYFVFTPISLWRITAISARVICVFGAALLSVSALSTGNIPSVLSFVSGVAKPLDVPEYTVKFSTPLTLN